LAKIASRISRQPCIVLTDVPSVLNSTSPAAAANNAAGAWLSRCQARTAAPAATAAARMVVSETRKPHNWSSRSLARSKDQLAAAKQTSRRAWGLRKPSRPNQASRG
jgi:hypothetical protein